MSDERGGPELLRSKRAATRYRVLVEIARRQPAVSQREIADAVGVTAQAVSEHLGDLADSGYVDRQARGRYEVTVEGVDWLISQTDALETYVGHVSDDVIGDVEVDTAVAADRIDEGERVALSMADGVLTATPLSGDRSRATDDAGGTSEANQTGETNQTSEANQTGETNRTTETGEPSDDRSSPDSVEPSSATALAVTDAAAGGDVAVAEFDGVLDYELGTVTVVEVPSVQAGGSRAVEAETLRECVDDADLVAAAGTEALTALRRADVEPDQRFGTPEAVEEAATKGLDVLLVAVTDRVSTHTDRLRDSAVGYEVVDAL